MRAADFPAISRRVVSFSQKSYQDGSDWDLVVLLCGLFALSSLGCLAASFLSQVFRLLQLHLVPSSASGVAKTDV